MSDAHAEDHKKHVRIYITVFAALAALTVVTVAVSYLHLPIHLAVALALLIATVKGSLVACYFMHLISERKMIYATLVLTVVFFAALMFLPLFSRLDQVHTVIPHHVP
jgi:cytochrome c oxidase subunit 4